MNFWVLRKRTRSPEPERQSKKACRKSARDLETSPLKPSLLYHLIGSDDEEKPEQTVFTRLPMQEGRHRTKQFKSVWKDLYVTPETRHLLPDKLPKQVLPPPSPERLTVRQAHRDRDALNNADRAVDKQKLWWLHEVQNALSLGPRERLTGCFDAQDHVDTLKFATSQPTISQVVREHARKKRQYTMRDAGVMTEAPTIEPETTTKKSIGTQTIVRDIVKTATVGTQTESLGTKTTREDRVTVATVSAPASQSECRIQRPRQASAGAGAHTAEDVAEAGARSQELASTDALDGSISVLSGRDSIQEVSGSNDALCATSAVDSPKKPPNSDPQVAREAPKLPIFRKLGTPAVVASGPSPSHPVVAERLPRPPVCGPRRLAICARPPAIGRPGTRGVVAASASASPTLENLGSQKVAGPKPVGIVARPPAIGRPGATGVVAVSASATPTLENLGSQKVAGPKPAGIVARPCALASGTASTADVAKTPPAASASKFPVKSGAAGPKTSPPIPPSPGFMWRSRSSSPSESSSERETPAWSPVINESADPLTPEFQYTSRADDSEGSHSDSSVDERNLKPGVAGPAAGFLKPSRSDALRATRAGTSSLGTSARNMPVQLGRFDAGLYSQSLGYDGAAITTDAKPPHSATSTNRMLTGTAMSNATASTAAPGSRGAGMTTDLPIFPPPDSTSILLREIGMANASAIAASLESKGTAMTADARKLISAASAYGTPAESSVAYTSANPTAFASRGTAVTATSAAPSSDTPAFEQQVESPVLRPLTASARVRFPESRWASAVSPNTASVPAQSGVQMTSTWMLDGPHQAAASTSSQESLLDSRSESSVSEESTTPASPAHGAPWPQTGFKDLATARTPWAWLSGAARSTQAATLNDPNSVDRAWSGRRRSDAVERPAQTFGAGRYVYSGSQVSVGPTTIPSAWQGSASQDSGWMSTSERQPNREEPETAPARENLGGNVPAPPARRRNHPYELMLPHYRAAIQKSMERGFFASEDRQRKVREDLEAKREEIRKKCEAQEGVSEEE